MKIRSFKHNFHDANLASFALGPRRELTLEIALDPVWNKEAAPSVSVRFGGIENYDEVASFFGALPPPPRPDSYIAGLIDLKYEEDVANWVLVEQESHGLIRIQSGKVSES